MDVVRDKKRRLLQVISLPIIWSGIIPLVIFDLWMEIYHRTCFPLYGLEYIRRGNYIRIDRHKLSYLNLRQKIGCAYCGYGNGLLSYWTKIVGVTEQYWCGIKHKEDGEFIPQTHHKNFAKYGSEGEFISKYK